MTATAEEIVSFWRDAGPQAWFHKSQTFDETIRSRFGSDVALAREERLDAWLSEPVSCLALILLLDQFTRNIFRDTPDMFAGDAQARAATYAAIAARHDTALDADMRGFIYMPLMHSEELADQDRSVALFEALGADVSYAVEHRDIIARFGRFPHRNAILGRTSTAEEIAFLDSGGFKG